MALGKHVFGCKIEHFLSITYWKSGMVLVGFLQKNTAFCQKKSESSCSTGLLDNINNYWNEQVKYGKIKSSFNNEVKYIGNKCSKCDSR